ncbi:uncharacterized protein LOC100123353 isoform X3 [Nasonia vitripennis]|uniref:G-protein coupled receptors family 1 profile domain-containing protein n=1 Tax=Nasonia vitripennis TaxID=7425 RepID=A0A7M7QAG4_NASVI|nr:uncharacterized protein LOC100123353 isoform X3 [Nasonia vitripennis]
MRAQLDDQMRGARPVRGSGSRQRECNPVIERLFGESRAMAPGTRGQSPALPSCRRKEPSDSGRDDVAAGGEPDLGPQRRGRRTRAEGAMSSSLLPSVTGLAEASGRLELGPVSIVLATLLVFVLSLLTVGSNSIILAAFYRYKRLRTASNCLLVSLAVSDFGVGVFMPFGTYLELADAGAGPSSSLCALPYCVLIALCSVSVLVTVAIAVDRLTSLAQPLRYKNIITHSSIEKYIAVFWIYASMVGMSPLIYSRIVDVGQAYGGSCRFNGLIMPPVRVFLFLAVWAPSALILLGCYVYVYLVARAHARAIYTVELSFRNQTQTLPLPRYGQTLAVTVGAFFILWMPFQTCMLLDIFCGTDILSDLTIWLGLPILAHSGTNPWIYAFHHGEMRVAAGKIAEELVALFGVSPSRYGCSPARRGSHTDLELAEVNGASQEERRPPVEDCFAAKHHHQSLVYASRRCLESSTSRHGCGNVLSREEPEQEVRDLARMLEPECVDSNHNVERIRSLKYLLDPGFGKIRQLRRLNQQQHKRLPAGFQLRYRSLEPGAGTYGRRGTMSEPMLSAERGAGEPARRQPRAQLASVSESNIREDSGPGSGPGLQPQQLSAPAAHSEPPSPIEALQEEDCPGVRRSEPVIPSVLLNVADSARGSCRPLGPGQPSELLLLRYADGDSIFPEHDSTRFSSRRPSDSKWSESSRSQELLPSAAEHPAARFPSSYSVNNFQSRNSGSELTDLTDLTSCLEPFMCSDALSSSLRESFFSAASVPDSEDLFASFEADEPRDCQLFPSRSSRSSRSSANLVRPRGAARPELQSKSTESMFRERGQSERLCAILKLEPGIHRSRPRVRAVACKEPRLAPLATPTPTDLGTPTFDISVVADIKGETGLGVRL